MANVNSDGGVRALPRPPKRPPTSALTSVMAAGANKPAPGGAQPTAQAPTMVDLEQDPILQLIEAGNLTRVQHAQAANTSGTKQALIGYGYEPGLEGLFPDQSTQDAAKGNPFSVLANLLYGHQQDQRGIDENLNRQNLFYSSEHDRQNADEQHHYQQGRSAAYGGLQSQLGGLSTALLDAQDNAATSNINGAADAYARYVPPTTAAPPGGGLAAVLGAGRGGDAPGAGLAAALGAGRGGGLPSDADVQPGSRLGIRPPAQIRSRL